MNKIPILICYLLYCVPVWSQTVVVNTEGAKLRRYGGLKYEVVATLERGDQLEIIGIMQNLEELGDYGVNCWLEVRQDTLSGYLYGALVSLVPDFSTLQSTSGDAFIHSKSLNANIRTQPHQRAYCLFQLYEGDHCQLIAKTQNEEYIEGYGSHPWYLIESKKRKGFVYGGLLAFGEDASSLEIIFDGVQLLDEVNKEPSITVHAGDRFQVLQKSSNSQVVHPYGRRYWYLIQVPAEGNFWVFGGFTSLEYQAVDCQCVDYIKHYLRISGPTAHAYNWPEILTGYQSVLVNGIDQELDYQEVPYNEAKSWDIAIFEPEHPQADSEFGHIGIVRRIRNKGPGQWEVLIEGGNHKSPISKGYYEKYRCHNVSQKWYQVTDDVHFFRRNGR